MTQLRKLLIVTSTLPADSADPVPAFVQDQILFLKQAHPDLELHVVAPHNAYAKTRSQKHAAFTEYRFHYLWPRRLELLAGRGIAPALKAHAWLYFAIPFLFFFEALAVFRLARKIKPDVLYVHWFMPQAVAVALVARMLRLPLVFTTHASDVAVLKKIPGSKRLVRSICRQAVAYTAVSEQTADRLRWFWPSDAAELESKLTIIPMGTNLEGPTLPTKDPLPGKQVITFIGRLVERKGVADLITAFKTVHAEYPASYLVIAGDGQDRKKFEQLVQASALEDFIDFPGYLQDQEKANLFARTDILCLPSIDDGNGAEGLPVVLMEGLAAGKIVVSSNVTGAQEYLTDGQDGYLYPQKDVIALEARLREALASKLQARVAMQTAARELASNFGWPKVAEQHYTVLQDAFTTSHD